MAALSLYNTLSRSKEEFRPIKGKHVGIYSCGPTVYNFAHIGNMRNYIIVDLLKRLLLHNGYNVKHVMNITDVGHLVGDANIGEDKVRLTAEHEHKSVHEVAKFYTGEFLKDMKRLALMEPEIMPKATDHIPEMLSLIEKLDRKGYLYTVNTGVYFDTSKFKNYGKLTGLTFDELNDYLISGARVKRASGIRNTTDFAVWRFSNPDEKDMVWQTPYGKGFPGWHIECSAMSMKYLGAHFDIHTGGIDHLPIHHTNEIAQSEAATGEKFVNYWVHIEFLQVNGKKMSKSMGNVYRIEDLIEKGYSACAYKYLVISAYYRSQLNFTFEALEGAESTLEGIYSFMSKVSNMNFMGKEEGNGTFAERAKSLKAEFFESLNNDLNTPTALSKLHSLISETNKAQKKGFSKADAKAVIDTLLEIDSVLGLGFSKYADREELPKAVSELIAEREESRKNRDYKRSDEIRDELRKKYSVVLEDTGSGPIWYREMPSSRKH